MKTPPPASTLVAACALVACATPLAHAQSSVTLSGTADLGVYRDFDKTTKVGGISRSDLTFSGVEDLGGGMAATFKLAARFHLDRGVSEDSKSFFSGESTVGLKGAFGQIRLGRALTAIWQQDWNYDPWENYNAIASPAWVLWHGNTPADPNYSTAGASYARLNNGIFYNSPKFGGVSATLAAGVEKQTGDNKRSMSGTLKYDNGPLSAMVGYERNPVNAKEAFAAAKYDFKAVQVMAAYEHEKLNSGDINRSATLSLNIPLGATELKFGYGRQVDYKANFFGAGAVYHLSKRTNIYASAGFRGKKLWGATESANAYGVGINHSF